MLSIAGGSRGAWKTGSTKPRSGQTREPMMVPEDEIGPILTEIHLRLHAALICRMVRDNAVQTQAQGPDLAQNGHLLREKCICLGTCRRSASDLNMYDECFESFTPVTNICRRRPPRYVGCPMSLPQARRTYRSVCSHEERGAQENFRGRLRCPDLRYWPL
jgi:hypothetical protein